MHFDGAALFRTRMLLVVCPFALAKFARIPRQENVFRNLLKLQLMFEIVVRFYKMCPLRPGMFSRFGVL